jgi:lipopolysaccharide transport system ATP-binding protein
MADTAITVRDLSKQYVRGPDRLESPWDLLGKAFPRLFKRGADDASADPPGAFWALKDISFDVRPGERVGIIGRNGAGKSTLLKILSRIVYPTSGEARVRGRMTSLLEVGTGFNPVFTGRENIYLNASLHGLEPATIAERFEEIVEFSGVRDFIDTPVRHYSSGMYMRLAFSVAAHLDPDILLLDEVLAVGDLSFQMKCLKRVEGLTAEGRTVLFVSHSLDAVSRLCERALWLDGGRIVLDGPTVEVVAAYVQEALGLQSSRTWLPEGGAPRPADRAADGGSEDRGPGNEFARLVSARVVNREGLTVTTVAIDEPVGIEVVYDVLREGKNIQPALYFDNAEGVRAFVAAYTDGQYLHENSRPGRYRATAWIPPDLLNEGPMFVSVCLCTPDPLERHCLVERAVSFHGLERLEGKGSRDTARGLFARAFPGVVRPKLRWETTCSAAPSGLEKAGQAAGSRG